MRTIVGIAFLCLLVSCVTGPSGEEATGGTTLRGSIWLWAGTDTRGRRAVAAEANAQPGDACRGAHFFRHFVQGGQVTVRGPDNDIIGVGSLEEGILGVERGSFGIEDDYCAFAFTVENLPEVDRYSVEAVEREFWTFTRSDLEQNSWMIVLRV